jgi:hypothetical protein
MRTPAVTVSSGSAIRVNTLDSARPQPLRVGLILLPLLYLPLFVSPQTWSLNALYLVGIPFAEDGFAIHLNVLIPAMGCLALLSAFRLNRSLVRFLVFAFVWLTIGFTSGMVSDPSFSNFLFFIQTVTPFFALLVGYTAVRDTADLATFVKRSAWVSTGFIAVLWLMLVKDFGVRGLIADRLSVIQELSAVIPQFRNYYPVCLIISANFALASYLFARAEPFTLAALAAHASFLPLCWSRSAFLGFVVSMTVQLVIVFKVGKGYSAGRALVFGAMAAGLLAVLFACVGTTVSERLDEGDATQLEAADGRRWEFLLAGLDRSWESPLFGDRFVPSMDATPFGVEYETKRLFLAHNQYVDLVLRGGYPFLAAFTMLVFGTVRRCGHFIRVSARQQSPIVFIFAVATLASLLAMLVGANFQLYFVQAQTAVPFFFLVGLIYRVCPISKPNKLQPGGTTRIATATLGECAF